MKTALSPVLRVALYRRAVACAWLTLCERQHRYPHLTLDALESAIAAELEGFYLRQHGEEKRPPDCLCVTGGFNGSRTTQGRPVAVLSRAGCDG
ncbi:FIG018226: DNA replication protein, phage-associated [Citrobacter freundii]|uniref:FIG018226: DNA replication protein, phage-associated n=1 Tax=Citrobacter freundii TaxID=546 RepID=A0A7G2IRX9_CITFR|nr:FIG018226: DNA replication protein, phage-associated [Citrobacter freundii]